MLSLVAHGAAAGQSAVAARFLADLTDAIRHELGLVEDLRAALLRQRAGVAADDLGVIDGSVQAIGRTLLTIEAARRRRGGIASALTGSPDTPLADLEAAIGRPLPEPLVEAREALRRAAEAVARDVAINQHVLRRALEAGDAFLQQLFSSATDPMPVYSAGPGPEPRASGLLLDRRA